MEFLLPFRRVSQTHNRRALRERAYMSLSKFSGSSATSAEDTDARYRARGGLIHMKFVQRWLKGKTGQGAYSTGKDRQAAGQYEDALVAFSDAERWLREAYGADHAWSVQASAQRGWCMVRLGRVAEAIPILEDSVAKERSRRGDSSRARVFEEFLAKARQEGERRT